MRTPEGKTATGSGSRLIRASAYGHDGTERLHGPDPLSWRVVLGLFQPPEHVGEEDDRV